MRPLIPYVVALVIPSLFSAGCSSIDTSAQAEGTGIQIVGAIIVLAKYQASQNQIVVAEARARQAFVQLAMKPAYEARAKKLRKIMASGPAKPQRPASGSSVPPDPAETARAELAALTNSWKETASSITNGKYAGDFSSPAPTSTEPSAVAFPRMSGSEVLAASNSYTPRFLAVPVPAEKAVTGSKATVMLWDTKNARIASDTVYALDRTPPTDKTSEIDNQKVLFTNL